MRRSDPRLTSNVYSVVEVETLRKEVERLSLIPSQGPTGVQKMDPATQKALGSGVPSEESRHPDLNRGPTDYESVALPAELCRPIRRGRVSSIVARARQNDRPRPPSHRQ